MGVVASFPELGMMVRFARRDHLGPLIFSPGGTAATDRPGRDRVGCSLSVTVLSDSGGEISGALTTSLRMAALATFSCMIYPGEDSAARVAQVADIAHAGWMQDWPIEVSDPARLDEFVGLLLANKADWELSFWLLDLVLESAEDDLASTPREGDLLERMEPLVVALVAVWEATQAPGIAQRLEYWACVEAAAPDEMFLVSPLVREARRRIRHRTG